MDYQTLIIGAGAAGMMCAAHAGAGVLVVDHAKAAGEKIRISGGGRCNFTNIFASPENFISANPHFVKSALSRYTQWDFIELITKHGIAYHEKTLGQLFCDSSAKDIIAMLRAEMAHTQLWLQSDVIDITHDGTAFTTVILRGGKQHIIRHKTLVMATGGKSIPKMGATGFAYQVADKFNVPVTATRAGLVPMTFSDQRFAEISGTAVDARVQASGPAFDEALLFTHRGLSGPSILQASSYWEEGHDITVNLSPQLDLYTALRDRRTQDGKKAVSTILSQYLPNRLVDHLAPTLNIKGNLADQSDKALKSLADHLHHWRVIPHGTEGYRTAEVTLGGIDTQALNSKTMAVNTMPNLYFIGEAVDVTGWLGGYNFQWAWSSGYVAGQSIAG